MKFTNEEQQARAEELQKASERERLETREFKTFVFWLVAFAVVAKILK